eukprot:7742-Heterococcus_DN1.PRE.4
MQLGAEATRLIQIQLTDFRAMQQTARSALKNFHKDVTLKPNGRAFRELVEQPRSKRVDKLGSLLTYCNFARICQLRRY